MRDLLDELTAVRRVVGTGTVAAGEAYTVELRRRYDAECADVWDAITSPERLARWLKPVTGDLRAGGTYRLDGGTYGEILRCEPPRLLKVSWLYGEDAWPGTSEVEVRLAPAGDDTDVELIHAAVADPYHYPTYGPGAGGVGWDLALLALGRLLAGREVVEHEEFESSPEGREGARRSAAAWGEAHLAAGGDPERVAAGVAATTAFYVPDLP